MTVSLPPEMPDSERTALLSRELERGRKLFEQGVINAIWRIPGGIRNVGVWEASDATHLHALIESLPVYRWLTAEVTALAEHPIRAVGR